MNANRIFLALAILLPLVLSFQNCGGMQSNSSSLASSSDLDSLPPRTPSADETKTQAPWTMPTSRGQSILNAGVGGVIPSIASAKNGDAVVVWMRYIGSPRGYVFVSEFRNGVWHHPSGDTDALNYDLVHASGDQYQGYYPTAAMDDAGNTIVLWSQSGATGADTCIFKAEYRSGSWTKPADTSDCLMPGNESRIAMSNDGSAIAISSYNATGSYNLYKNEYRNGQWELKQNLVPINLQTGNATVGGWPQVAMDDNGNALIAWTLHQGPKAVIQVAEYRNGVWKIPTTVDDKLSGPAGGYEMALYPKLAMGKNGDAILLWEQSVEDAATQGYPLFFREYSNGAWKDAATLPKCFGVPGTSPSMQAASVAVNKQGKAIIAFVKGDLLYKCERKNDVWSAPKSISDRLNFSGAVHLPSAAIDDDGNVAIAYSIVKSGVYKIYHSDFRNGKWSHPQSTANGAGFDQSQQAYVTLAHGVGVMAWAETRFLTNSTSETRLYLGQLH